MTNHYKSARSKRKIWSNRAVSKKASLRIERALSPQAESPTPVFSKSKPEKFSVKINLERHDGERIQFICHRIGDRIYRGGKLVAPKSFFRNIGAIVELWSRK